MPEERAKNIKVMLFDVDGVMTNGGIWLFPATGGAQSMSEAKGSHADKGGYAIHSESMIEAKGFNAHDGTGISLARFAGIKLGVVTKRISEAVALRARDLRLDYVYQGISNKFAVLQEISEKENLGFDAFAYVGDDIIDLPVMRRCGLAIAVQNARADVKSESHYVTENRGGEGAVRDAIEFVLRAQGKLEQAIEAYIGERSPVEKLQ